ncbi:glycosyltransferase family 2 protein [Shewanella algae]|uniref:glycosyltransferase family 2 protein n=1 Tax=Shewanella algae TaxID=38313 RepID=UPI0011842AA5|nr:glycosyltransferase family 2 protein [Shewanella algae]MBO2644928.1 glycosyltransferase family 2 protein [Shewanella algae]TVL14809.1 hypothetical protein AYJ02_12155 [Shewanella algae]WKC43257.1 glycosyltransferase family 2 protein [Shewanella algae]
MLRISFLFLNYKSVEYIESNVKFIDDNVGSDHDFGCVVVNNDEGQEISIATQNIRLKVIEAGCNSGYARGNNLGIDFCRNEGEDFCVVCNPDIKFDEKFLVELNSFLHRFSLGDEYNDVCAISIGQEALVPYYNKPNLFQYVFPFFVRRKDYASHRRVNSDEFVSDVYRFHGACFIIPLANISEWEVFFRQDTFLYMEEDLLSLKAHEKCAKIVHSHSLSVTHIGGVSTKRSIPWKRYFYYYDGLYIIFRTYFGCSNLKASLYSFSGAVVRFFLELRNVLK